MIVPGRASCLDLAIEVGANGARFLAHPTTKLRAAVAFPLELVCELQGRQYGDGLWWRGLGAALKFLDLVADDARERMHVRLFGVTFDGVVLAGNGHGDGAFQMPNFNVGLNCVNWNSFAAMRLGGSIPPFFAPSSDFRSVGEGRR